MALAVGYLYPFVVPYQTVRQLPEGFGGAYNIDLIGFEILNECTGNELGLVGFFVGKSIGSLKVVKLLRLFIKLTPSEGGMRVFILAFLQNTPS